MMKLKAKTLQGAQHFQKFLKIGGINWRTARLIYPTKIVAYKLELIAYDHK